MRSPRSCSGSAAQPPASSSASRSPWTEAIPPAEVEGDDSVGGGGADDSPQASNSTRSTSKGSHRRRRWSSGKTWCQELDTLVSSFTEDREQGERGCAEV